MIKLRRPRPPFRDRSRPTTLRVEKQYSSGSKDREIKRERKESEKGERKIRGREGRRTEVEGESSWKGREVVCEKKRRRGKESVKRTKEKEKE